MPTEWVFKLRDQVSGPAQDIQGELKRVVASLKQLDTQAKQNQLAKAVDPLKKQRLELQLQRDKLLQSKRAMDEHGRATDKTTESHKNLRESIVRWAASLYILDTARRAFAAVGRAASDMAGDIREAVETQQRGLFGLRAQLGGGAGSAFFGGLERQAQVFGRPPGEIVGMGQGFLQAGATTQNAGAFVAAVQDIRARSGAAAAQQFQGAVQSMITSPNFTFGSLQSFAGVFPMQKLLDHFSREMGVNRRDVEPVLNLNQMRSGQAQGIMQRFVAGLPGQNNQLGTLGAQFAGSTLEGSFGRVSTAWERLLASLASSRGVQTLQNVLQNLAGALESRDLRQSLTSLVNTLGDFLKPLTGAGGREKIVQFFGSIADTIKKEVVPALSQVATFIQNLPDQVNTVATVVQKLGKGVAFAAGSTLLISPDAQSQDLGRKLVYQGLGLWEGMERDRMLGEIAERDRIASRGYIGAETPIGGRQVHVHGPLVHVDARGASREDAKAIGDASHEGAHRALNEWHEGLAIEQSGGVP